MMIAIFATVIFYFALAQNCAALQKGSAFQASSPKNFRVGPSGPALFLGFVADIQTSTHAVIKR
jgi:hypothetical protein